MFASQIPTTGLQELASFVELFVVSPWIITHVLDKGKAFLRLMLLDFGHTVVRVHQHDRVAICTIREGSFVTGDALVCEGLEYLLEGRLCDAVLLNAEVSLFVL